MAPLTGLRRARPADAPAIAAIYAAYVTDSVVTFETEAPDAAEMAARMATTLAADLPYLVAEDDAGALIGYAYAGRFHPRHAYRFTVEPSIYLARDARGRGVGTRLYEALIGIVTQLGYRQAIALVSVPNAASDALHARMGFRAAGLLEKSGYKFDDWIDVALFQRELAFSKGLPEEPLPLHTSAIWRSLD